MTAPLEYLLRYLYWTLREHWQSFLARGWPITTGTILSAGFAGSAKSRVAVVYTYSVNGDYHSGTLEGDCITAACANYLLSRYQPKGHAPVFFNPDQPERSYLPSGVGWMLEEGP